MTRHRLLVSLMLVGISALFGLSGLDGTRSAWGGSLIPFEDPDSDLWGYKTIRGAVAIPARYYVAGEFSRHGLAAVVDASGWQYVDTQGRCVIRPFVFDNGPDPFSEGLARFREDGKFGFFDETGRVVIPARFDFVKPFSGGSAEYCEGCTEQYEGEHMIHSGGTWGRIDRKGRVVKSGSKQ